MTYLKNTWYVAASAAEIGHAPVARTLLEIPVVLFRTEQNNPVALFDQCPHRLVPLSMGKVCGDAIQCAYHGLQFDSSGQCSRNPHSNGAIPRNASVHSFPVIDRYGFLWFWPGEISLADTDLIPRFDFLNEDETHTTVGGYLHVNANYQLVVDNLLDLSHVEFLHPLLARPQGLETTRTELIERDNTVTSNRWKPNVTHNGLTKLFWTSGTEKGDSRANMTWNPPSNLSFDLGTREVGETEGGLCLPAAHLITPETETTSHYFWAQARNWSVNNTELGEKLRFITDHIFRSEDKPIAEAQQKRMGASGDLMAFSPVSLEIDAPAMRARRILVRLIENEIGRFSAFDKSQGQSVTTLQGV